MSKKENFAVERSLPNPLQTESSVDASNPNLFKG